MDRRNVIRTVFIVSVVSILTCVAASITAAESDVHFAAHFDGGLPATVSKPVDPRGPFPLPAAAFFRENADNYFFYWDFWLQTPRHLSPPTPIRLAPATWRVRRR